MARTLFFEGVGTSYRETVEGAIHRMRIRTAFHGKNGNPIFLEVSGNRRCIGKKGKHIIYETEPYAHFEALEERLVITDTPKHKSVRWESDPIFGDDTDLNTYTRPVYDRNGHETGEEEFQLRVDNGKYPFTEAGILDYLKNLGYDFTDICVLPDDSGYRAFKEYMKTKEEPTVNFGDDFVPVTA